MYLADEKRYEKDGFRRCGDSGLLLSKLSLGLWHNFGDTSSYGNMKKMCETAFDNGITHFDLANNYGPEPGSAEINFGKILKDDFMPYRDKMIISTKAGYDMWPGPYGNWGSRKYLIASLDQSLKRLQLDYVDIFYHHRMDPETPLEESMMALDSAVKSGKALYAGISNYPPEMAARAYAYLREAHVPCLVYQGRYNMLDREAEAEILPQAAAEGVGYVAFSPLAQGLLTNRYLDGIPADSRMRTSPFLTESALTPELLTQLRAWNEEARAEGLTLAQYALRWILRRPEVTSVIVGARSVAQLLDSLAAVGA